MKLVKAEQDLPGGCAGLLGRNDVVPWGEMTWFLQFGFIFISLFICTWEDGLVSSGVEVESEHKFPRSVLSSHPVDLGGGQFVPFLSSF